MCAVIANYYAQSLLRPYQQPIAPRNPGINKIRCRSSTKCYMASGITRRATPSPPTDAPASAPPENHAAQQNPKGFCTPHPHPACSRYMSGSKTDSPVTLVTRTHVTTALLRRICGAINLPLCELLVDSRAERYLRLHRLYPDFAITRVCVFDVTWVPVLSRIPAQLE